ncbi:MAG: hypothetical protein ACI4S4_07415, partial [Candidatus Ornithospirochaeta sp.]
MHRKLIGSIVLLLTCCSLLSAATLSEIIQGAKDSSPTYQNILLSYENSLISLRKLENDDKVGISASVSLNPLYTEKGGTNILTGTATEDKKGITLSNDVTVSLPNDGGTQVSGNMNMVKIFDGDTSLSVTLGASHTIDFTGYSSTASDDINYTSTKYNVELSRKTSELNFEKSVISTVSALLTYENSIASAVLSLEKQKAALAKMETLGTYSKESPTYVNALNTLSQLQASLDALGKQYENAKESYRTLTGMDWSGIDEIPEPSLELKTYENGNTSVLLKALNVEAKEEAYRKEVSTSTPSSLSLSGSVSGDVIDRDSVKISGSVSYRGNNFSLSAQPGVTVSSSSVTPTLTIGGSWNNGGKNTSASTSSSGSDNVKTAMNNLLSAQNDYTNALSSYYEEAQSLSL